MKKINLYKKKMSHNFLPTIKKDVSYCSYCGCLSYKDIPSQNNCCKNNSSNLMKIDPLIIRYQPISLKIDFSLNSHINYINYRKNGLLKIYFLSNNYNLNDKIKHKAIGLMDQIFLKNKDINFKNIEIIASICVLLSIEFNNYFYKSNKNELNSKSCKFLENHLFINNTNFDVNNRKSLKQYIKNEVKNLMYWQTFCLKKLDYNIGKYSALDYLCLFFELGIVFTKGKIDIINNYNFCFNIMDIIINNYNICKYNQYVIALSVIYITFNDLNYFNKNVIKYIYGIDFSKKKYQICINEINNIIKDLYNINNNYFYFKNQFINNSINHYYNYYNNYYKDSKKINNNTVYKNNNNENLIYKSNNNNLNNSLPIRELLFKYFYLFEIQKANNYINNIQINNCYNDYFSSFNFSYNQKNDELLKNDINSKCDEKKNRISFINKEEKYNINSYLKNCNPIQ